jgi:hypothetical protein
MTLRSLPESWDFDFFKTLASGHSRQFKRIGLLSKIFWLTEGCLNRTTALSKPPDARANHKCV